MLPRLRAHTLLAVAGSAAAAGLVVACGGGAGGPPMSPGTTAITPPTGNMRVLSAADTHRLLQFAERLRTCVESRGVKVGAPVAARTRITMRFVSAGQRRALGTVTRCGDSLGEPPQDSSLQVQPAQLVLYLPRQCLLDPKVTAP
jgi:hypothetical protein